MKDSIQAKLDSAKERFEELSALLSTPEVIQDQTQFRDYSKEYAQLDPLVNCYARYQQHVKQIEECQQLMQEDDPEMRAMAEEDFLRLKDELVELEKELTILILPKDPDDDRNIYLEIRAGTGGDEAAIFAGDLYRMYSRFAESQRWQIEVMSVSHGEHGGYKEVIAKISGNGVYALLKYESGAHRVQRVPETESQGRVHTSACTVAVMPEIDELDEVVLKSEDLRIDTYRASGAGGQHINKTDSAIRITHLPTGIVVECQDERSQHKNRSKAMSLLQSKIMSQEQARVDQEQATTRRNLVGTGDRSERIRTYNYPQGRITDHRINLTVYKLDAVMEGDLDPIIQPLRQEHQLDQMAAMGLTES